MWGFARVAFEYACEKNLLVFGVLILLTCVICYCLHLFKDSQKDNNTKFNWMGGKLEEVKTDVKEIKSTLTIHGNDIIKLQTTTNLLEEKWGKKQNAG
jgi:hypothetical protein